MNRVFRFLLFLLIGIGLATIGPAQAQQPDASSSGPSAPDPAEAAPSPSRTATPSVYKPMAPFSRFALGGGLGINGFNLQAATIVNRYTNLRLIGNVFGYSVNGISSNGFTANGTLDLATLGAAVDFYPFPHRGLRVSPGLLLYNQNSLSASATVSGGNSFTLNNQDYYSSNADPVKASVRLGLGARNPAFTLTTGWGNMISRKAKHRWSFPVEIGAAFVGSPSLKFTLTGTACDSTGRNCVNVATDPTIQANLKAQIDKYRGDLDPLKVFPIFSVGAAYSFGRRP